MKIILIPEQKLEELFEIALKDLKLESLISNKQSIDEIHRKFHYIVSCLKENIIKA